MKENSHKATALIVAAQEGYAEIVKALLAKGADVNAKDNLGQPPLEHAAIGGHVDVVRILLAGDADVNAKNNLGPESVRGQFALLGFFSPSRFRAQFRLVWVELLHSEPRRLNLNHNIL